MTYNIANDLKLRERAQRAFPAGVYGHQASISLSPDHPQFFARARGARLWDTDGNEYIDFMCAYGTNLLGYHHPGVDEAARQQQAIADSATGPSPLMVELAETFKDKQAHADWAMFAKNGTDATTICIMTARAQTGRNAILVAAGAYHGAAPWCTPGPVGTTDADRAYQLKYRFNDIDSVRAAVAEAGDDLAAIVVSPFKHDVFVDQEWPGSDFAQGLRSICDATGAALILDDVRCAFRFSLGSTWETIGVLPDLSAMSKSVANGYALAVVTGNDRFREGASQIYSTGSFWFASVSFAAALATMEAVEKEGAIEQIRASGDLLRTGLDDLATAYGFALRQTGPSQMPLVLVDDDPTWEKTNALCAEAAKRGVYMHPWHNMFICAAHREADIREALERVEGAFAALQQRCSQG
jgi:glutamate-1-semialdehyde 2,1-aminomutase